MSSSAGDSHDDLFGRPASIPPRGRTADGASTVTRTGSGVASSRRAGQTTGGAAPRGGTARARRTGWRRFVNYPRAHVTSFRRWLPSWRVLLGGVLGCIALGVGVVVAAYATTKIPDAAAYTQAQVSTIYYDDGKTPIARITYQTADDNEVSQNRKVISLDDVPEYVGNAVVASEDRTFYKNSGIDPKGIARAFLSNVQTGGQAGGSTITQQYAERYYTSGTTSDYVGKFKEALLAIKISKSQDKHEILENYLNTIYFGRGASGIETASEMYYGVSAKKLTVSQAALLASVIPSPTNWDPRNAGKSDLQTITMRWQRTLNYMLEDGYIDQAQHDKALAGGLPTTKKIKASVQMAGQNGYIVTMAEKEIEDATGMTIDKIATGGYKIVTTIDRSMENDAVAAVKKTPSDASKHMETGLVTIDQKNGEIKALYGGPDYIKHGINNVTRASAQGGSTFKAFALAASLEQGNSLERTYQGSNGMIVPGYSSDPVYNFEGESSNSVSLKDAFAESINSVFAQVNVEIGPEATAAMAKNLGIQTKVENNPANVLGTASVHPLELANAYATIAAGGLKTTPHIVRSVKTLDGQLVYEGSTKATRVLDPEIAAGVTDAMIDVVQNPRGTGATVRQLGRPAAGKTGTSNENRSAWFAGFTPDLTTVVGLWQSAADGKSEASITPFGQWRNITIGGGTWPASLWTDYMKTVLDGKPVQQFGDYTPTRATWTPTETATPTETPTSTPTPTTSVPLPTVPVPTPTRTRDSESATVPPGLVGQSVDAVRAVLAQHGFSVVVTRQPSATVPPGVVISVFPGEGAQVRKGRAISVVESSGPAIVAPPTQPANPVDPVDPADPVDPSNPDDPNDPSNPNDAGGSSGGNHAGGGRSDG